MTGLFRLTCHTICAFFSKRVRSRHPFTILFLSTSLHSTHMRVFPFLARNSKNWNSNMSYQQQTNKTTRSRFVVQTFSFPFSQLQTFWVFHVLSWGVAPTTWFGTSVLFHLWCNPWWALSYLFLLCQFFLQPPTFYLQDLIQLESSFFQVIPSCRFLRRRKHVESRDKTKGINPTHHHHHHQHHDVYYNLVSGLS